MNENIRVLLVDDQELFRRGLAMVLSSEGDIEVYEASTGEEAERMVSTLAPDIVLLDVRMPGASGVDVCRAIKDASPSTGIIMLTSSDDEADLYASIKNGASGYLLKDASIDDVAAGVRLVSSGQSLISPSMATKLLSEFVSVSAKQEENSGARRPTLTNREMQVLMQVAKGRSNKEIAAELVIAENTVKNHIRNILEKLQLKSRMEVAVYALRAKIVDD